ncbi:hypothetical protein AMS68_002539 [Peltaster fructicola]|uniref:Uncharacterized protein n=1 Tax=Peltaster fructicola TaxID=286661 RepID=A0A6H0XQH5_9PEZI|nr:hypothetical protein AMS68_002539 [Peltaster fructicola]
MQSNRPFDPIRDDVHYAEELSGFHLPPIRTGIQEGRLPAYSTIMSPFGSLQLGQDRIMSGYDSSYDSMTPTHTPRGSSIESTGRPHTLHNSRRRRMRDAAAARTRQRQLDPQAKNLCKAHKALGDRQNQALFLQYMADILVIICGYKAQKLQTKGNGRKAGLVMSKDEIQGALINFHNGLFREQFAAVARKGPEGYAELQRKYLGWIKQGDVLSEGDLKVFRLHKDNIFADPDSDNEPCIPMPESDPRKGACSTHTDEESQEQSKDASGNPDARQCRLLRRMANWERNFARIVEEVEVKKASSI